jgi:MFS family permease
VTSSALAPLRRPVFRALWIAIFISSLGTWMHDVGAGWLMASLEPDPFMVALVQAAVVLPGFFLALPAGALADIVDRRIYLIIFMCWLIVVAGTLGILTLLGLTDARVLLALSFAMGVGAAMMLPAFSAVIPDLVPRHELTAALTLNNIAANSTRALGPMLAGVLIAIAGPAIVFLYNAVSYLALLAVLIPWRNTQPRSALPSERFFGAMRTGLKFAAQSPALKVVLLKSMVFFLMGSTLWAFLPLIVKQQLGGGPQTYGALFGAAGVGAVIGGLNLARLRRRLSSDHIVGAATLMMVMALLGLATLPNAWSIGVAMLVAGAAWVCVVSTLQVSAQLSLPHWVRARGLALWLATFMGSIAAGSAGWGKLASLTSISTALFSACAFGLLAWGATAHLRLARYADQDRSPTNPTPDPLIDIPVAHDRGPVMVQVDYRIDPSRVQDFQRAMRDVRRLRLRNGALSWNLFQDAADQYRWMEVFVDETWLSHLRQHHRLTVEDRAIKARGESFHEGSEPPFVTHMIARNPSKRRRRWQRF